MIIINIPRRWRPLWALGACGTWLGAPLRRWGAPHRGAIMPHLCVRCNAIKKEYMSSAKVDNYEEFINNNDFIFNDNNIVQAEHIGWAL